MLSNPALEPHYDEVTWLFVTRNFTHDSSDREAERTHDRFGITSWPQIPLFDPRDDRVLAWLPRDLQGFVAGLERHGDAVPAAGPAAQAAADRLAQALALRAAGEAEEALRILDEVAGRRDDAGVWLRARELRREWTDTQPGIRERLVDPDVRERAIALETIGTLDGAARRPFAAAVERALLDADEHLLVRLRALRVLAIDDPTKIGQHAAELLACTSDPFRFEVLAALATSPSPELTATLVAMFNGAGGAVPSANPNVLRIHLAKCLAACGDARAVPPLAAVAHAADVRNGLTGVVVDALAAIGERHQGATRALVVTALQDSWPPALEDAGLEAAGDGAERRLLYACERLHRALSRVRTDVPALPQAWTRKDRAGYLAELRRPR